MKEKVINLLKAFARNHEGFRIFARKLSGNVKTRRYKKGSRKTKTDKHLIYFNTFSGRSYADTPKAIYEYMLKDERFKDYRFVWMFEHPEKYRFLEKNRDTVLVKRETKAEFKAAQEAGYWITNYRMLDKYIPKDDQVYVQCWHGTPLKRLGFDLENSDNAMNSQQEIFERYKKDTLRFKYIISPSPFATEKFSSAWKLKEFGKEDAVIEEGYPRNDRLINASKEEVQQLRQKVAGDIGNKKIILYAPTWRDNQYTNGVGYTYKTEIDFDLLQRELGNDYIILFRAHYLVAHDFDFDRYKGFVYDVSDHDDINDLYLISDLLVTDYSSVFFDYANLKRPMLFYMYDIEDYRDDIRGFYIDLDELPGQIVYDETSLISDIRSIPDDYEPDEKYMAFRKKYNPLDDGNATARTIEKIFFD